MHINNIWYHLHIPLQGMTILYELSYLSLFIVGAIGLGGSIYSESTLTTTSVVVNCSGDEENILACIHNAANCSEDSTAGVICQGMYICNKEDRQHHFQSLSFNSIRHCVWELLRWGFETCKLSKNTWSWIWRGKIRGLCQQCLGNSLWYRIQLFGCNCSLSATQLWWEWLVHPLFAPIDLHTCKIPTAAISYHNAKFGEGNGPVFLHNLKCVGSEGRLLDCDQSTVGHNLCDHSNDVGVRCYGVCSFLLVCTYVRTYVHVCT